MTHENDAYNILWLDLKKSLMGMRFIDRPN